MKLTYLEAYYYKLLLEVGFIDDVNNWITSIAENNEILDGINLELVCCLGNNSKVISCLHNYIDDNEIDYDDLATRLRLFILNKYENGLIDLYQIANSLSGFVNLTGQWHNKTFSDFSLITDAYTMMLDGMLKEELFINILKNYLKSGDHINYDSLLEKPTLNSILKKEKQEMNKIRSVLNYTIVPIVLVITCTILISIFILLTVNEEIYTILSICLFVILALIYILLLILIPIIRKKEVQMELGKYDFTISNEVKNEYIVNTKKQSIIFKKDGLYWQNKHYKYDNLIISFLTSKYLLKVNLFVEVIVFNDKSFIKPNFYIDLDNELLNALIHYDIEIENKDKLIYIINNKEKAFNEIMKYGYLK